ncbi:hypothetical protein MFUL124B02_12860 [Myxococcus fulvus 124B02]|nr:hypothetical protein MFUL124B02_12860 [Myxococcus fulvus 124B02]
MSSAPYLVPRASALTLLLPICRLFLDVVLWHAWLSGDAYILLRTVDRAVRGHGLR